MGYLVCVPWGTQIVASARKRCALCERFVAVSLANTIALTDKELRVICADCCGEHFGTETEFRALIGGVDYRLRTLRDIRVAVRAADLEQKN